jgi:ABC-type sugar transport system ATPase subunit
MILVDVVKQYENQAPLRFHYHFDPNHVTVLFGRSGSGKTTLLRLLSGLEEPSQGRINWSSNIKQEIGLVFQQPALIPHLNVRENLAIGWQLHYNLTRKLWWARTEPSELRQRLDETIPLLELEPFLKRLPSALSGGQQHRVALGRCLIRRPAVFLLDEPLAHLDLELARRLRTRLVECFRRWRSTVVWVTHDLEEANTVADKLIRLDIHGSTSPTT